MSSTSIIIFFNLTINLIIDVKMSLDKYKQVIHEDFLKDIDFIDKTIKELNLNPDSKILDIGTGIGAMAILLALNHFSVLTGEPKINEKTDHSVHNSHDHNRHSEVYHENQHIGSEKEELIQWGDWKESAEKLNVLDRIKYQHFNVEKLPFPSESFNGIFMYDTLQHVQNRDIALEECLRVLIPDGVICVIEWSKETIEKENEEYGYGIEYVNPMDYLRSSKVSIEMNSGKFVIIYLIQKN